MDGSQLSISDLYENSVLTLTIPNNTGRLSIATNFGSSFTSSGTFNPRRTYAGLKIDAIFDLDNNSVSGTLTYQNAADSNNEVSDSFKLTLNDNTSISQLVTSVNSRSKNNEDMVLDNTKFYAVVDSDTDWEAKKTTAAGAVTLNYIDSSNNSIGNSEIDVTNKYAEDKLTYYYPAYISYDGKLYKSTADTYAGDVVLTADAQTLPIAYEEVSGTVQYKEFTDDKTAYDSAAVQYTSNGKVYGVGGGKTEALTVAADGIYKITAPSVRVDNDSYRNGTVLVNDVSVGTVSFDNSTTNDVVENIELKAGDTIAIQGSNSKSGVDYIFIEKTADITPEAPTATATKIATVTKNADQPQAAAYTAEFTGNGSSYNKIIWTINPTEGTKTSAGDDAAAQTKEVELPSTISGESDFVIGLVVNIADADTIDSITGELGN